MRRTSLAVVATTLLLTSCTLATEKDKQEDYSKPTSSEDVAGSTVVLVTHASFKLPKKLIRAFESQTGMDLELKAAGDGGELTTKLVLNQEHPLGDAAFGVDNTFASRALDGDVFAAADVTLPDGAEQLEVEGDDDGRMVPIDRGSVCVNVDTAWFTEHDLEPPTTLDDLTDAAYDNLFVVPGASTSTPGMAFLLSTIAAYGDEWPDYWADLMGNGAKLVSGWEEAYGVDFTGGWGPKPTRPIVVSYDSSPAFTVDPKTGESSTAALLDTCFRQVEYAGVLEHAANPAGARLVVEWLLSPEVQAVLPENMFVFPVDDTVELPADWAAHAVQPTDPYDVSPSDIAEHRDEWLTEWTDVTTR
jgi:thiamine transport system substrate-binding protein